MYYTTIGQRPILNIILHDRSYTNSKDNRNYKQKWLYCLLEKSRATAGGSKTEGLPPWCGSPKPPDKENLKGKKRKTWEGERGKKNFVIIKDKSSESSMFWAISFTTESRRSSGCAIQSKTASEDQSPWRLISSTGVLQRKAQEAPPWWKLWPENLLAGKPAWLRTFRNWSVNVECVMGMSWSFP